MIFPIEDSAGAYCERHSVTLLWRGAPIRVEDLASDTAPPDVTDESPSGF
ncbi:hypothetical protein [Streptomyces montanisoli]|uniref:Uncharacterized protein n=1 Tax=Streptomyces montanisoli TaxID=2798581 RepID=A0A940RWS4_9ACTN|nr:hypothetical protein [Streptomyces montanisoli]MBP0460462.1 hypothetical protein [Streptomyces montanisoli]